MIWMFKDKPFLFNIFSTMIKSSIWNYTSTSWAGPLLLNPCISPFFKLEMTVHCPALGDSATHTLPRPTRPQNPWFRKLCIITSLLAPLPAPKSSVHVWTYQVRIKWEHLLSISTSFIPFCCLRSNQCISSPFKLLTCNELRSASHSFPGRADKKALSHSVLEEPPVVNI